MTFGAGVEVDEPEIFVLDISAEEDECAASGEEGEVSRAAGEGEGGEGVRCGFGCGGFDGECGADIGARVYDETAVGRPCGVDGVVVEKGRRGSRR